MNFAKNTTIAVALAAIASGAVFGGIWLQNNQPGSPPEPGRPQASIPGNTPSLTPNSFQNLKHTAKQSVVRFSSEANKQDFLNANNLSLNDLKTVPLLANTYTVSRSQDELISAGALVTKQQQYTLLRIPNDRIPSQWYTDKISAPAAWDISTGSSSIIVADIDTGFALNHEDLASRWATGGWDFVHNDNDPSAGTDNPTGIGVSHGTITAGLIGAASNNAKGVAAINWEARILPLQALNDNGEGNSIDVASAIHYAVDQGAKVINMSLGTPSPDPIVKAELDYAQSHDVVVVAAAGNCGGSDFSDNGCSTQGQMVYPANYPQVLAVGATNIGDVRASFSSYGPNLDVVAPGSGAIQTTAWSAGSQISSYTTNINGTSFSSPIVAGLAALYRGYVTTSSASGTITAITSSADKLSAMIGQSFTVDYGFGRINAAHALSGTPSAPAAPATPAPPPETTPTIPLPEPEQPTHPNGTLISLAGRVYLVENGVKRWITNGDVFNSYGYPWFQVKEGSTGDGSLTSGADIDTLAPGTIFRTDNSPVYVMTYENAVLVKQQIAATAFDSLGYNWNEVVYVPPGNVPAATASTTPILFAAQHPAGTLVAGNGKAYLLAFDTTSNQVVKRWIINPDSFVTNNFDWNKVKTATTQDLALPDGTGVDLRQGNMLISGGSIYLVDYDSSGITKRPVGPWECFADRWHYTYRDLYQTVALPDRTGPLATC